MLDENCLTETFHGHQEGVEIPTVWLPRLKTNRKKEEIYLRPPLTHVPRQGQQMSIVLPGSISPATPGCQSQP